MKMQQHHLVSILKENPASDLFIQCEGTLGYSLRLTAFRDEILGTVILHSQRGDVRYFKTADSALRLAFQILEASGSEESSVAVVR